jgi:hypothetical protein
VRWPPSRAQLDLRTPDEVDAFVELYGYWLGDGWLNTAGKAVSFGPEKRADWDVLDRLFARLVRVLPVTATWCEKRRERRRADRSAGGETAHE